MSNFLTHLLKIGVRLANFPSSRKFLVSDTESGDILHVFVRLMTSCLDSLNTFRCMLSMHKLICSLSNSS